MHRPFEDRLLNTLEAMAKDVVNNPICSVEWLRKLVVCSDCLSNSNNAICMHCKLLFPQASLLHCPASELCTASAHNERR